MHTGRTPKDLLRLVCFMMAALLLAAWLAGCAPEANGGQLAPLAVGEEAPDFSLVTVNGEVYSLAQFDGKPVIVYFWTSWCQTCREEMAALAERYRQNGSRGPTVLAINSEEAGSMVADFAEKSPMPFPLLVDIDGRVGDLFGMQTIPTTYLIDANGVLQQIHAGTMSSETIDTLMVVRANPNTPIPVTATIALDPTGTSTATTIPSLNACVTTGVLNVRSGPSTTAPVIDGMAKGECAEVDARTADGTWLRFKSPIAGERGWAAAKFLALNGPPEGLLIAE